MKRERFASLLPARRLDLATSDKSPAGKSAYRRRVGRFREARSTRALRATLGTLSRVAPRVAATVGYRLLSTPPRVPERPWQRALRLKASVERIPFGSRSLAVYSWGNTGDPTILMVHGWGARATHMGRMIDPLVNAGLQVVSFDAPAHGESWRGTTDLVEFAGAVDQVARHTGPLRAVIAHSFGAAMAQIAARDWGTRAERQVLISSFDHCDWFCDAFGHYAGLSPAIIGRMKRKMVIRNNFRLDWERTSVVEMLRQSPRPTLLVHDEDDLEIPFAHSVALAGAGQHATLLATRGLGHHRVLGDRSVIDRVVAFVRASTA